MLLCTICVDLGEQTEAAFIYEGQSVCRKHFVIYPGIRPAWKLENAEQKMSR